MAEQNKLEDLAALPPRKAVRQLHKSCVGRLVPKSQR